MLGVFSSGSGLIVARLKSACTGQVYFPVIEGLAREEGRLFHASGLFLFYNLLFVLPLILIFIATFFGVGSNKLASLSRRQLPLAKFDLGSLFLLMAHWMAQALAWPPRAR